MELAANSSSGYQMTIALPFVENLIERMNVQPRDRILDVGCGEGRASRLLAGLVPEGLVVGVDISGEMVRQARVQSTQCENLMFIPGEVQEIPWQEGFFSKVLCVDSFYYFENPEKALREIHRVLSPGGSLWILNLLSKENELSLRLLADWKLPGELLDAEGYGRLLRQCGFLDDSRRMIPGRAPLSGDSQTLFPDAAELERFRQLGGLLLTATKPQD
jgi:SAM-dependent methyltransferase